jgi:hypothetical protein
MDALYETLNDENQVRQEAKSCEFDSILWLKYFEKFKENKSKQSVKLMRCFIQFQTIYMIENNGYVTNKEVKFNQEELKSSVLKTKIFHNDFKFSFEKKQVETVIRVVEGDCLDVALLLKNKFQLNPIVLNMADEKIPGGGYKYGAGAQEEGLHRRTNLYQHLDVLYFFQLTNRILKKSTTNVLGTTQFPTAAFTHQMCWFSEKMNQEDINLWKILNLSPLFL